MCSIAWRGRGSAGWSDSKRCRTCSAHAAAHSARSRWSVSVSVPPRRMVMNRRSRSLGRITSATVRVGAPSSDRGAAGVGQHRFTGEPRTPTPGAGDGMSVDLRNGHLDRAARDERERVQETMVRVNVRPIGHPLPLGFIGLAAATIVMAALQLDWFPATEGRFVAYVLIAFVAPVQLVASIFSYLGRDSVGGTGMGILAGTWLTVGLVISGSEPGTTSKALGTFLLVAGAAMLVPALSAATGKLVPALVLFGAATRFAVTGMYQVTGSDAWKTAAGVFGLVLGAIALYAALAIALGDALKKEPLPLG